jgi:hypothetical protein
VAHESREEAEFTKNKNNNGLASGFSKDFSIPRKAYAFLFQNFFLLFTDLDKSLRLLVFGGFLSRFNIHRQT